MIEHLWIGGLSVSVEDYHTYSFHISARAKYSDEDQHNARILPANFNPLRYINHPHNLEGDATTMFVREPNIRTADM